MRVILQVFCTLFSSILLSLAIPNEMLHFGSPFIAFIALIPYYLVFKRCRSFFEAGFLGFIQPCATHLLSSFWLAYFKDFAALTLGASALGTGFIGSLFGLFFYLPYYKNTRKNSLQLSFAGAVNIPVLRIFWFAAVYTAYEWFKSSGFLGYPWGTISSCMFRAHIFMQLSAITGTYGITFLTVFFTALCGEGIPLLISLKRRPTAKHLLYSYANCVRLWLIFMTLTMVYGFVTYSIKREPTKTITTIMVQQNEDPWLSSSDGDTILRSQELTFEKIEELKESNKSPDLVVWSEGAIKSPYPDSKEHYKNYPYEKPLTEFIKETGAPLLTGGSYMQRYKDGFIEYYNAALMFDKNGNFRGYYGKNHLVPFAEAIPFMEFPVVKEFMAKIIGISAGWSPGKQYTFFNIPCKWADRPGIETVKTIDLDQDYTEQRIQENKPPFTKISAPICFDDAFTDIMRPLWKNGSEVFMNITDDSWSLKDSSEIQHFVIASYRAIEYRTTLVRSTNAGLSCVLDPAGKVLCELPLFESCAASYDIPVYERKTTTYARFGNWLPFILILFILFQWIIEIRNIKKTDFNQLGKPYDTNLEDEKQPSASESEILFAETKEPKNINDPKTEAIQKTEKISKTRRASAASTPRVVPKTPHLVRREKMLSNRPGNTRASASHKFH